MTRSAPVLETPRTHSEGAHRSAVTRGPDDGLSEKGGACPPGIALSSSRQSVLRTTITTDDHHVMTINKTAVHGA